MSELHDVPVGEFRKRSPSTQAPSSLDSSDPQARRIATVRALASEGYELEELDRADEALAVFRRVIEEFGKDRETEVREQVAFALLRTGLILCFTHRRAEAMGALGALLKSFKPGESKQIDECLDLGGDRYQKLVYGSSSR
jgi:hypothetical protein